VTDKSILDAALRLSPEDIQYIKKHASGADEEPPAATRNEQLEDAADIVQAE